jgi:hypothetical protein
MHITSSLNLSEEERDNMLNILLTPAYKIRVEMPGVEGQDNLVPIVASSPAGITIGDFLNAWFGNNINLLNDRNYFDRFEDDICLENISKKNKYVNGERIPTKDDIFVLNFSS